MKRLFLILIALVIFTGCDNDHEISGDLNIPGAIFKYSAEGKGIPCIVFTGSENIGHKLYPERLRKRLILIHADPAPISPEQALTLTLDDVLDDIERVRKHLGLKKIAVMGHSIFGTLPLDYAVKYPKSISFAISTGSTPVWDESFVLEEANYWETFASDERKLKRQQNNEALAEMDLTGLSASDIFKLQYQADVPYRFYDINYDSTFIFSDTEINIPFVGHFWGTLLANYNHDEAFQSIKAPVLVLSGLYDFAVPHTLWNGYENIIDDYTSKLYLESGHNPMLEVPEQFTRDIIDWIDSKKRHKKHKHKHKKHKVDYENLLLSID